MTYFEQQRIGFQVHCPLFACDLSSPTHPPLRMYIEWFVILSDSIYVRSGVSLHTVTLLMTIWNAKWTMSSLSSLTFFPCTSNYSYVVTCVDCFQPLPGVEHQCWRWMTAGQCARVSVSQDSWPDNSVIDIGYPQYYFNSIPMPFY